jgi:hypothetical protein
MLMARIEKRNGRVSMAYPMTNESDEEFRARINNNFLYKLEGFRVKFVEPRDVGYYNAFRNKKQ